MTRTGIAPGWNLRLPQFVEDNALWIALIPILLIVLLGFLLNKFKTR